MSEVVLSPLSAHSLELEVPPGKTCRWVSSRHGRLVRAVGRFLPAATACASYGGPGEISLRVRGTILPGFRSVWRFSGQETCYAP